METPIVKRKYTRKAIRNEPVDVMPVVDEIVKRKYTRKNKAISNEPEVAPVVDVPVPQKERKPNAWLIHTKKIRDENPNMSYKDILVLARESYKK